jgi:hypothetical protein
VAGGQSKGVGGTKKDVGVVGSGRDLTDVRRSSAGDRTAGGQSIVVGETTIGVGDRGGDRRSAKGGKAAGGQATRSGAVEKARGELIGNEPRLGRHKRDGDECRNRSGGVTKSRRRGGVGGQGGAARGEPRLRGVDVGVLIRRGGQRPRDVGVRANRSGKSGQKEPPDTNPNRDLTRPGAESFRVLGSAGS